MNEGVRSATGAHQDAVEVVSSHVGGGSRQQRPRLALVVSEEALHLAVDQFVGQIHAVYTLHLQGEGGETQSRHFEFPVGVFALDAVEQEELMSDR